MCALRGGLPGRPAVYEVGVGGGLSEQLLLLEREARVMLRTPRYVVINFPEEHETESRLRNVDYFDTRHGIETHLVSIGQEAFKRGTGIFEIGQELHFEGTFNVCLKATAEPEATKGVAASDERPTSPD